MITMSTQIADSATWTHLDNVVEEIPGADETLIHFIDMINPYAVRSEYKDNGLEDIYIKSEVVRDVKSLWPRKPWHIVDEQPKGYYTEEDFMEYDIYDKFVLQAYRSTPHCRYQKWWNSQFKCWLWKFYYDETVWSDLCFVFNK